MLCCPCCLKNYIYIANPSGKLSRPLLIRSKGASKVSSTQLCVGVGVGWGWGCHISLWESACIPRENFYSGVRVF